MRRAFDTTEAPARALAGCLTDLAALLEGASDLDYQARPDGGVSGSVGAHVRHCLDHVRAVVDAANRGRLLSYDGRERDTALEQNRPLGILALRQHADRLDALVDCPADQPMRLEAHVDCTRGAVEVTSSLGRELVFVLQHTIHHQAIVALLLAARGIAIPPRFGYAPSTVRRHAEQLACAR
jgi:uncharacterized damage-inducible protein DinB